MVIGTGMHRSCAMQESVRQTKEVEETEAVVNEHIDSLVASAEKEAAEEHEQALKLPHVEVSLMLLYWKEKSCTI